MDKNIFIENESAVRSYSRNFPVVFNKALGPHLYDEQGNYYIDFFDGAGALNYGHNNPYIKTKVIDYLQSDGIIHGLDMFTTAKGEFIQIFKDQILTPRGLDYKIMSTGPTGTNAIEAALKLARKNKKSMGIFAFMGCYHGMTLGALALTTDRVSRSNSVDLLNGVTHIPTPYMIGEKESLAYIEMLLTDDHSGVEKPAAFVIETIQAEGGVHIFSDDYLRKLEQLLRKYEILLIIDDIQVGCGRVGTFFSFEKAGIKPDMVVLSKSIGGYGFPLALLLVKEELDIFSPAEHNGTFRGNQLAFVAGKAAIELYNQDNYSLLVETMSTFVKDFLNKEIAPLSDKLAIRGCGLLFGIDFFELDNSGVLAKQAMDICFNHRVIVERVGRANAVLKIMPALNIDQECMLEGLNIIKKAVIEVLSK